MEWSPNWTAGSWGQSKEQSSEELWSRSSWRTGLDSQMLDDGSWWNTTRPATRKICKTTVYSQYTTRNNKRSKRLNQFSWRHLVRRKNPTSPQTVNSGCWISESFRMTNHSSVRRVPLWKYDHTAHWSSSSILHQPFIKGSIHEQSIFGGPLQHHKMDDKFGNCSLVPKEAGACWCNHLTNRKRREVCIFIKMHEDT